MAEENVWKMKMEKGNRSDVLLYPAPYINLAATHCAQTHHLGGPGLYAVRKNGAQEIERERERWKNRKNDETDERT